jgi:osmotically-inducible protein OsmY
LLSPAWAVSTTREPASLPLWRATTVLLLNASAEQIGAATRVRSDGQLAHDVAEAWGENPALAPYTGRLSAEAHDGDVTLGGTLPSPRHRATAEQDAWHVAGVLAVHNLIRVEG